MTAVAVILILAAGKGAFWILYYLLKAYGKAPRKCAIISISFIQNEEEFCQSLLLSIFT